MKKIILGILLTSLLLSGCQKTTINNTEEKLEQGTVVKTGEIKAKAGNEYLLNTTDGIVNITSNKIDFDDYMDKKITVTGMFSGSTLYVDELKEVN